MTKFVINVCNGKLPFYIKDNYKYNWLETLPLIAIITSGHHRQQTLQVVGEQKEVNSPK